MDDEYGYEDLRTLRDFIRWGASRFSDAGLCFGHGTERAIDEAAALVLYALHLPYDLSSEYFGASLTRCERQRIADLFKLRIETRKPSAYLTREAIFAGHVFYVDERVLVPRSPFAELILDRFEPWVDATGVGQILELCTGSGCIAISAALAMPDVEVDAVDVSPDALAVARMNVERFGLGDRVALIESDLFAALGDGRYYDIIVSNPPYVSTAEWQTLPDEFHAEPRLGLDGGLDGLDLVRRILASAADHLNEDGVLIVEVGSSAATLLAAYPLVPFHWLEFERGGDGVFLLTREQLVEFGHLFRLTECSAMT